MTRIYTRVETSCVREFVYIIRTPLLGLLDRFLIRPPYEDESRRAAQHLKAGLIRHPSSAETLRLLTERQAENVQAGGSFME
jgi:hypothetical protein